MRRPRALLATAALALLSATAVHGAPVQAATAATPCPANCLTCDAKRACTSCNATFGLNAAKRCVKCSSWACLDCNLNYKRCTRCAFGNAMYIAANGTCQRCGGEDGRACVISDTLGCRTDGSCHKCADEFARIKGQCQWAPDGCSPKNTLQDGTCKACDLGYGRLPNGTCSLSAGGCTKRAPGGACMACRAGYTLQGGKCVGCPYLCIDCTGDPTRCRKCYNSGPDASGQCTECDFSIGGRDCADCSRNASRCTQCAGQTYLKDGGCKPCRPGCAESGCDSSGHCKKCASFYGRVGKECVKCKVRGCVRCNGDAGKCQACPQNGGFGNYFPNIDGTFCISCLAHRNCTTCDGNAHGKCLSCGGGWGAIGGTCKRCKVAGCESCNGDVERCNECTYLDEDVFQCDAAYEFDPRTKTCARLPDSLLHDGIFC